MPWPKGKSRSKKDIAAMKAARWGKKKKDGVTLVSVPHPDPIGEVLLQMRKKRVRVLLLVQQLDRAILALEELARVSSNAP